MESKREWISKKVFKYEGEREFICKVCYRKYLYSVDAERCLHSNTIVNYKK